MPVTVWESFKLEVSLPIPMGQHCYWKKFFFLLLLSWKFFCRCFHFRISNCLIDTSCKDLRKKATTVYLITGVRRHNKVVHLGSFFILWKFVLSSINVFYKKRFIKIASLYSYCFLSLCGFLIYTCELFFAFIQIKGMYLKYTLLI